MSGKKQDKRSSLIIDILGYLAVFYFTAVIGESYLLIKYNLIYLSLGHTMPVGEKVKPWYTFMLSLYLPFSYISITSVHNMLQINWILSCCFRCRRKFASSSYIQGSFSLVSASLVSLINLVKQGTRQSFICSLKI